MSTPDPSALIQAQEGVSALVERDLTAAFNRFNPDLIDAETLRDAMIEITQRIVGQYGDISATVAADWYDVARAGANVTRPWHAIPETADNLKAVEETVRRLAGDLFTDHPETMLERLIPHAQQYALESGRLTITRNTAFDQASRGWVRVTNPGACDYCEDLAAVEWRADDSADFEAHTNCNSAAVPAF